MEGGDAVAMAAEAQGEDGHAKFFAAIGGILAAQGEEILFADAEIVGVTADVFESEFWIEAVIAGGDRRVGGEDAGVGDAADGGREIDAAARETGDAFEGGEGGVAFVHVNDSRGLADGIEGDQSADAEENFLPDAVFAVAAVEVMSEQAVGGFVAGDVGVEEEERHAADGLAPDFGGNSAVCHGDIDDDAGVGDREFGEIQLRIDDASGAIGGEFLGVKSAAIEQADADEGNAEIGGGFDVIAGKDAQAAGILREGFVDGEFGAEIGDLELAAGFGGDGLVPGSGGEVFGQLFLDGIQAS